MPDVDYSDLHARTPSGDAERLLKRHVDKLIVVFDKEGVVGSSESGTEVRACCDSA